MDFEDILLTQHPVHQTIYGITLHQHWETPSYRDSGYLFLMIDFQEEEKPTIHVRTWQPAEDVTVDEVFRLNDFWINTHANNP